jgi:hypothetical protein
MFSMEEHLDARGNETSPPDRKQTVLSERDTRALIILCTELIAFCSRLVGNSNPTVGAMLSYIRDEVASRGIDETI